MTTHYPQLIVGGASKSGTTALYYYLNQHPEFFLPSKKELHFFSRDYLSQTVGGKGDRFILAEIPTTFQNYIDFFNDAQETQIGVDISPSYLFHYKCAGKIIKRLPEIRIVFILRNPVDKIYSQYLHLVSTGRETLSFSQALDHEKHRENIGYSDMWLYKKSGYYADAIKHFISVMGKKRVRIYYYEEFINNRTEVLADVCKFAGVDSSFQFTGIKQVNRSGLPKSKIISSLFLSPGRLSYLMRRIIPHNIGKKLRETIKNLNTGEKPGLAPDMKRKLANLYKDDLIQLEKIIKKKCNWISVRGE